VGYEEGAFMRKDYRGWLETQEYSANTISTQCSHALRIEQAYGDLDELHEKDRLEGVLSTLRYTSDDARRGAPNPSKIQIGGDLYKSLASFRTAVGLYQRFKDHQGSDILQISESTHQNLNVSDVRDRIGIERDLQKALRRSIDALESGLTIVDEGAERLVPSGYIDITARDASGSIVVIELKAGTADRAAIGQILSYMGDVAEEDGDDVRGILVAHKFDGRAIAAAKMVPNLILRTYSVSFSFGEP
jgi:hypothetical protein